MFLFNYLFVLSPSIIQFILQMVSLSSFNTYPVSHQLLVINPSLPEGQSAEKQSFISVSTLFPCFFLPPGYYGRFWRVTWLLYICYSFRRCARLEHPKHSSIPLGLVLRICISGNRATRLVPWSWAIENEWHNPELKDERKYKEIDLTDLMICK